MKLLCSVNRAFAILASLSLVFFASSCNTTKFLNEGETLITKSKVKIITKDKKVNKTLLALEVEPFILQKPNKDFLFIPREYIYYKNAEPGDTSRFDNWRRNKLGEIPAILDSSKLQKTIENLKQYVQLQKGFYDAEVNYSVNTKNKKASVVYEISLKEQYKISSIEYFSEDKAVLELIKENSPNALIKKGDNMNASNLSLEKSRINLFMQDLGYADFVPQYIDIKGDSSMETKTIALFFEIFRPRLGELHKRYNNGTINVYTDYYNKQDTFSMITEEFNNIRFHRENSKWVVKPSLIANSIFIKPNSLASRTPRTRTFKKLNTIGAYRFTNISTYLDEDDSTKINYNIYLTPENYRWQGDFGTDFFYSNTSQFQNLVGISLNGRLQNRNLMGGGEQYTLSGDISTELNINGKNAEGGKNLFVARQFSTGLNNNIEYPRVIKYVGSSSILNKLGIITSNFKEDFHQNATTNVSLGYNYLEQLNFFKFSSFNGSLGYKYNDGQRNNLSITQLGISLNNFTKGSNFSIIESRSPIFSKSFQDNLFTGILFNKLFYLYNKPSTFGFTNYNLLSSIETSGLEIYAANKLYNRLTSNKDYWSINNNSFQFSKFIKVELDNRFTKIFSKKRSLAYRFDIGGIVPFGDNEVTPFIIQFNNGGPNSLRGWIPRQMVGGIVDSLLTNSLPVNQGDVKLETNIEYRFDLTSYIEGAFFIDAGNVWSISKGSLPASKLTTGFYKQIAVAAGWGLRLDVEYFIIRLDFGYKIKDPFINSVNNSYWRNWAGIRQQRFGNIQVGINYPF